MFFGCKQAVYRVRHLMYLFAVLLCMTQFSFAETVVSDASIGMSPTYAGVGEKISATLRTSALDLQSSLIVWTLDTTVLNRGIGVDTTSFTLKDVRKHEITATVTDQTGYSVKITEIVRASDVDILWEGISYVPPGYKGRTLYSDGGKVRVTALPHAEDKKTPADYVYTWTQDGKNLPRSSGFGKSSLTLDTSLFGDSTLLNVQVKTLQGEYIGGAGVRITPSPVIVGIYEQKALLGLWTNTTVKNAKIIDRETTLRALPYFMDISSISESATKYTWNAFGATIVPGAGGRAVLSGANGNPKVGVTISNKNKILQEGSTQESVGISEGRSLFGI